MALYNGVAGSLVDQALDSVAAGTATEIQKLLLVLHAENEATRNVMREESDKTRRDLHIDIETQESEGITLFGRKFNRSSILLAFGISIGLHGVELVIIIARQLSPGAIFPIGI